MSTSQTFTLASQKLDALPMINFFLTRMGMPEQLGTFLPTDDARLRLASARVIAVVVRNIRAAGHWTGSSTPTEQA